MPASRIYLRAPQLEDQREFLQRMAGSQALHKPWVVAKWSPKGFREYVERMSGTSHCALLVCLKDTDEISGVFNISNIVRGGFQSAFLGYYAFAGFEGQGLMREGLKAVVRHAFKELSLHRLEANIQPGNGPSIALVKACGFRLEGYSPRYLKIGGRWRDHERWAIVAS